MSDWFPPPCEIVEQFQGIIPRTAAANVKGAFATVGTSTFAYSEISLYLTPEGGGGDCFLVDIAIGASGSEQIVIPNILVDSTTNGFRLCVSFSIPIGIPELTRIAARVQDTTGSGTRQVRVSIVGRAGGFNKYPSRSNSAINYGAVSATTNGTLIDPGSTVGTYGAWTELTPGTSILHSGCIAVLGTNHYTSTIANNIYLFQIGVGASGAEVPIAEFLGMQASFSMQPATFQCNSVIPAGSRLAMRAQCIQDASAGSRNTTAILLGF